MIFAYEEEEEEPQGQDHQRRPHGQSERQPLLGSSISSRDGAGGERRWLNAGRLGGRDGVVVEGDVEVGGAEVGVGAAADLLTMAHVLVGVADEGAVLGLPLVLGDAPSGPLACFFGRRR